MPGETFSSSISNRFSAILPSTRPSCLRRSLIHFPVAGFWSLRTVEKGRSEADDPSYEKREPIDFWKTPVRQNTHKAQARASSLSSCSARKADRQSGAPSTQVAPIALPPLTPLSMGEVVERSGDVWIGVAAETIELVRRVNIPINSSTPPDLIAAIQQDPWSQSSKYGLAWVYFGIILLIIATALRLFNFWGDRIRTALFKEEVILSAISATPIDAPSAATDDSRRPIFFPPTGPLVPYEKQLPQHSAVSAIRPLNQLIAMFRYIFYRPISPVRIGKLRINIPSLGVVVIVSIGIAMSLLYCFIPRPLFYASMSYGSPPLAIRAGMMSVSLLPWVVVLAAKANPVSYMTGIGHERLAVLHRWGAYICCGLAVIHAVPYWWQSIHDPTGFQTFKLYFTNQPWYIFTTGVAALVPLLFLVLHSLPILRKKGYEVFVLLHAPVAWAFIALLFWHCNNYLASWSYLYASLILLVLPWFLRLFYLNWMNPLRASWLIGEEAAVTILPENAVKVTIPSQKKWKPGQYAYLRMPGIAIFENHPFTIASLCSEDFPSEYGEQYRDMTMVFRPFSGFTRKVLNTSLKKGPYKTYRAFIDGPYGGMQRQMSSFDKVVFVAGGSGITAIASQVLDLVKRIRDGKATTTYVHVIWAMKRPELMEWFKEELRICRECAPPNTVQCDFFITAAKRYNPMPTIQENRFSGINDKINDVLQDVASKRNSALVAQEELKSEAEDEITALPQAYLSAPKNAEPMTYYPPPPSQSHHFNPQTSVDAARTFDFGFPQTPTKFQKNLMRFAFLPTSNKRDGWRTEYGRPDIPYMLRDLSKHFGRRTCIYVCGPTEMRTEVARTVAGLQTLPMTNPGIDEIFLHAENYAI